MNLLHCQRVVTIEANKIEIDWNLRFPSLEAKKKGQFHRFKSDSEMKSNSFVTVSLGSKTVSLGRVL